MAKKRDPKVGSKGAPTKKNFAQAKKTQRKK